MGIQYEKNAVVITEAPAMNYFGNHVRLPKDYGTAQMILTTLYNCIAAKIPYFRGPFRKTRSHPERSEQVLPNPNQYLHSSPK